MTKKKKKSGFKQLRKVLPYFLVGILSTVIVVFGSFDKRNAEMNVSLDALAASNYKMSVDQLSELYMVADLSDILGLASATDVASNYVIATTMYDAGQTSSGGRLEKPVIADTQLDCRGIFKYTVSAGESADTIAAKFGLTADQVRWSNDLKNSNIAAGREIELPCAPGIIYTVKNGDTIASIVSRYGSNVEELIAVNDLEKTRAVSEGMRIVIKNGNLPETERPEYVAPVRQNYLYTYTYLGSTSVRQNMTTVGYFYGLGGPYSAGQCTQWAWYKRQDLPRMLGNANSWAYNAALAGYLVNRTPAPGAIFQTSSGWFGHVGYVEAVNPDGSIVISEMNYDYQPFRVIQSVVPANMVGNFNYIH